MAAFSTFTYAKKYFVSDEIEFVTEKDLEFDITYTGTSDYSSISFGVPNIDILKTSSISIIVPSVFCFLNSTT